MNFLRVAFDQSMFGTGFWPCHSLYRWIVVGFPILDIGWVLASTLIDALAVSVAIRISAWVWKLLPA